MKKTLGLLLAIALVASLALIVAGTFHLLNFSDDTEKADAPYDETDESTDKTPEDNDPTENAPEPDPEPEPEPEPEPDPEIGEKTEYTYTLESEWDSQRYHASHIVFEEKSADAVNVTVYFGTFIKASEAFDASDTLVRLVLTNGEKSSILAEIEGKYFYNDKYLCEKADALSVKYTRMMSVTVPEELLSENKGQLTFTLSAVKKDAEDTEESVFESVDNNVYYKKKDGLIELSSVKETANVYNYEYLIDISDYIGYIEPTGDKWSDEYLLLVNPWNPIEKDFELGYGVVGEQIKLGDIDEYDFSYRSYLKMNSTAAYALTAMFKEALATGNFKTKHMQVVSAHRAYEQQESIFNRNVKNTKKYVCTDENCAHEYITKNSYKKCEICGSAVKQVSITREEAEAQVKTYSCAPGTSEHQTGLAVDLADISKSYAILEEPFKDTAAGKWLAENCTKFGFILRFEKEKQDITGIIYEPWHFRYVGRYHATRMTEMGLCFEEYVELLKEEGYFDDADSVHNPSNMEIDEETFLIVGEKSN